MAAEAQARRRAARGGRAARRARQAGASVQAPAFIKREIPFFDLLNDDGLDAIEAQADKILAEIGIEFRGDDEALRLFRQAGARVEGALVRFEPGQIRELAATAPAEFIQHARNSAHSVPIGGGNTVFSPSYGAPFVRDLDKGRRYGTIEDFENFVKLAYASPWLHHSGGTVCEPVDLPVNKRHLDMTYAHMRWSDKAFMGSVTAPERAHDSIEMCRLLFGADFVDANCVIMGNINVNSPLVYDDTMSGALRAYAEANQCPVVVPFILGGAMGPVTPAACVAQAHAEAMTGIALGQLARPGSPVIYGNFLTSMSLRSGAPTFGMPEPALAYMAVGQLARRNRLPLRCGGAFTSSKIPDAQAAQESSEALWPAIVSGVNFVLHSVGWLEGGLTMGYEKFMLDADRLGAMHRLMRGLDLDDNAFAMDAYREVGPGKHFLGAAHTLANYEDAYYEPALMDADSFEQWRDAGGKSAEERANARWKQMLSDYEAPAIDPGVDESLRDYIERKKGAVADAWH